MTKMFTFTTVAAAMLLASLAYAYPTLTSPTGYAVLPNGATAPAGLTIAADAHELETGTSYPIRAIVSLGAVELAAMYDPLSSDAALDQVWGGSAKIRLGRVFSGATAIGGQFRRERATVLGADVDTDYSQAYLAWTSNFGGRGDRSNLELTLGGNWTQINPPVGNGTDALRGFAGLRIGLTPDISIIGEYQTKSTDLGDTDPITALTARFQFSPNFGAQVGTTNAFGFIGGPDQNMFAGISIRM